LSHPARLFNRMFIDWMFIGWATEFNTKPTRPYQAP
jgi:hypothetical protein